MKKMNHVLCMVLLSLSTTHAAHAELTVVADHGGKTTSAMPYYEALQPDTADSAIQSLPSIPMRIDESAMLPVVSQLSPGRVTAKTLNAAGLVQPVFLVGYDKLSMSWLAQRGALLAQMNAVGMAVNVPNAKALAQIRASLPGVSIMPVSGDDLATRLGITHYPVLITSTGIEQ